MKYGPDLDHNKVEKVVQTVTFEAILIFRMLHKSRCDFDIRTQLLCHGEGGGGHGFSRYICMKMVSEMCSLPSTCLCNRHKKKMLMQHFCTGRAFDDR